MPWERLQQARKIAERYPYPSLMNPFPAGYYKSTLREICIFLRAVNMIQSRKYKAAIFQFANHYLCSDIS